MVREGGLVPCRYGTGSARGDHHANRVRLLRVKERHPRRDVRQAAEDFARRNAQPLEDGTPHQQLAAHAHRFAAFCTSDVARYQLLFQHPIPGFSPSPESYAPAVRALESARQLLRVPACATPDTWTCGPH